jgi:hypothetical protein
MYHPTPTPPPLASKSKDKDTISFIKIWSDQVPGGSSPIQLGDYISWHFATFEDLITEKSRMTSTSFLTEMESGMVGYGPYEGSRWLLRAILEKTCFLEEKSIWKLR